MLLNMKNIRKKKVRVNKNLRHWKILAITITAIQIYLIGKESTKKTTVNPNRRNQVKNQKPNGGIYLIAKVTVTVTATIREEIRAESAPVVAIGLKGQRNPRNIKEKIRNEIRNDKRIKYQDLLNLSIEENPKDTGDLDHPADDNIYTYTCINRNI